MNIKRNITIFILLLISLLIAGFFLQKPITSLLSKNHLLPEPETFTELYFEDHANLPKAIEKDVTYVFFFTTHNLEHADMNYLYEVAIVDDAERQVFDRGNFSLKHDASKTTAVKFTFADTYKRVKIETCLTKKNQCIHFWMQKP